MEPLLEREASVPDSRRNWKKVFLTISGVSILLLGLVSGVLITTRPSHRNSYVVTHPLETIPVPTLDADGSRLYQRHIQYIEPSGDAYEYQYDAKVTRSTFAFDEFLAQHPLIDVQVHSCSAKSISLEMSIPASFTGYTSDTSTDLTAWVENIFSSHLYYTGGMWMGCINDKFERIGLSVRMASSSTARPEITVTQTFDVRRMEYMYTYHVRFTHTVVHFNEYSTVVAKLDPIELSEDERKTGFRMHMYQNQGFFVRTLPNVLHLDYPYVVTEKQPVLMDTRMTRMSPVHSGSSDNDDAVHVYQYKSFLSSSSSSSSLASTTNYNGKDTCATATDCYSCTKNSCNWCSITGKCMTDGSVCDDIPYNSKNTCPMNDLLISDIWQHDVAADPVVHVHINSKNPVIEVSLTKVWTDTTPVEVQVYALKKDIDNKNPRCSPSDKCALTKDTKVYSFTIPRNADAFTLDLSKTNINTLANDKPLYFYIAWPNANGQVSHSTYFMNPTSSKGKWVYMDPVSVPGTIDKSTSVSIPMSYSEKMKGEKVKVYLYRNVAGSDKKIGDPVVITLPSSGTTTTVTVKLSQYVNDVETLRTSAPYHFHIKYDCFLNTFFCSKYDSNHFFVPLQANSIYINYNPDTKQPIDIIDYDFSKYVVKDCTSAATKDSKACKLQLQNLDYTIKYSCSNCYLKLDTQLKSIDINVGIGRIYLLKAVMEGSLDARVEGNFEFDFAYKYHKNIVLAKRKNVFKTPKVLFVAIVPVTLQFYIDADLDASVDITGLGKAQYIAQYTAPYRITAQFGRFVKDQPHVLFEMLQDGHEEINKFDYLLTGQADVHVGFNPTVTADISNVLSSSVNVPVYTHAHIQGRFPVYPGTSNVDAPVKSIWHFPKGYCVYDHYVEYWTSAGIKNVHVDANIDLHIIVDYSKKFVDKTFNTAREAHIVSGCLIRANKNAVVGPETIKFTVPVQSTEDEDVVLYRVYDAMKTMHKNKLVTMSLPRAQVTGTTNSNVNTKTKKELVLTVHPHDIDSQETTPKDVIQAVTNAINKKQFIDGAVLV